MRTIECRSVENQGKSEYEKGRKDKPKFKEVEKNWRSVEMERVAEKSSYWTRAMAWLQQLAHTHTHIHIHHKKKHRRGP